MKKANQTLGNRLFELSKSYAKQHYTARQRFLNLLEEEGINTEGIDLEFFLKAAEDSVDFKVFIESVGSK